jgi:hypothetical protein
MVDRRYYSPAYGKPQVKQWKMMPNPNWRCDYCGDVSTNQFEYIWPADGTVRRVETCDSCALAESGI